MFSGDDVKNEERETVFNLGMAQRQDGAPWTIYSDDPVIVGKLKRVCLSKRKAGAGWFFDLAQESVIFRRALTDQEKAQRIERIKKAQD